MRKLLPLFILCLVALSSQGQWVSQASGFPAPAQVINQIVFTDSSTVWATGDGNQEFTRTTDGGITWVPGTVSSAASTYDWSCFAAVDDQNAWAMFFDGAALLYGFIYRTDDGGQTWNQQAATLYQTSESFADVIYFWNDSTGVAIGDPISGEYEIYTTNDGGTTWNAVAGANIPNPTAGEFGLTRSFAVRGNTLWFGTNKGRLYKTIDFGTTWSVLSTGTTDAIVNLDFANDNVGWVELSNNSTFAFKTVRRTIDGGSTWTNITPTGTFFNPSQNGGMAYVPYTAYTLVASGYYTAGAVYGSAYSLDAGDTWITIDSFVGPPYHYAVAFFDNLTGWSGDQNVDSLTGMWKFSGTFVATDVNEPNQEFNFRLYPNPSNGLYYFSFDAANNQPIHIHVIDGLGKTVFDKTYKDKSQTWLRSIDLRNSSKGIYFLDLENNGNHAVQKLVIN